jgi:hypothetical protein
MTEDMSLKYYVHRYAAEVLPKVRRRTSGKLSTLCKSLHDRNKG